MSTLRDIKAAMDQAPARDIIPPVMDQEDKQELKDKAAAMHTTA
ncbi:MAG: hypothetical protein STSR0002_18860 [Smithella sp.]|jgi:hypothetical protein